MTHMLRTAATLAGFAVILTLGIHTPASAQQTGPCGYWSEGTWISTPCEQPSYQSSPCGYWSEGVWVASPCAPHRARAAVSGTIVGINSTMLTVQTGPTQTVVVNDEPALNRMDTGHIYTGRVIVAYGYWDGGEFVATSIS
ncbi:MAG: hypothetical protein WB681_05115 [Candidatus Cybelea sp.]